MFDTHYTMTRCPDSFEGGASTDFYADGDLKVAVAIYEEIVRFCRLEMSQHKEE